MRFLGIDYGKKRIGLALSDDEGRLAFPKEILFNDKKFFLRLAEIIKEEEIGEIVLGDSEDFKGKPNEVMEEINDFAKELKEKFSVPVFFQKEFLTSVEARRYQAKREKADARAAALILQRYLDKINKQ